MQAQPMQVGFAGGVNAEIGKGRAAVDQIYVTAPVPVARHEIPGVGTQSTETPVSARHRLEAVINRLPPCLIVAEQRELGGQPVIIENVVRGNIILWKEVGGGAEEIHMPSVRSHEGRKAMLIGLRAIVSKTDTFHGQRHPVPKKRVIQIVGISQDQVIGERFESNIATVGAECGEATVS